jgi:sugar-specific transcriptional regulator TrmB
MAISFLQTIGLSKNEAELYELLLRLGEVPVWKIQQEVTLKRPTLYLTLQNLEKKGLVSKRDFEKKIHFRPEPPTKLLSLAEKQYNELDRAKIDLQMILPQMTSSYIMAVEKPIVTTYEGIEGLKHMYEDTVKEQKTIYSVLQTAEVDPALYKWLTTTYIRKRIKLQIPAKVIVASGKWSEEYQKKDEAEFRETILVPSDRFPIKHELVIYGDKVGFINYKKGESLLGVLVNHPQIAQTMKAFFDLAWLGAHTPMQPPQAPLVAA